MNDVLQNGPHLEAPLEEQSGEIFDRISPLFGNKVLYPVVPSLRTMVEQLSAWRMFEPISDPVSEIYDDLYWLLCKDTHVIPDMTMMGRLMAVGKDPSPIFEPTQEEFDRFRVHLCRVAEVGALAVLNVLEDDDEAIKYCGRQSRRSNRSRRESDCHGWFGEFRHSRSRLSKDATD